MQTVKRDSLFTELTSQEAATVSGASGYYFYRPVYYCYPVSWGSSSGSSTPSVNQTVNVNVVIED